MNKKIKTVIELMKAHKKETIGLGVALGIAVIGASGYALSKHYSKNKTETNDVALAEKKEETSSEAENNDDDLGGNDAEVTETEEIVVEEQEDGSLIVKDKDGNTIADSSKGDNVTKVLEEKKATGGDVNIKDKDGTVSKVESVESGSITVTGGSNITVKPSKPSNNSSSGGTESNQKPQENNNTNKPTPPVENKPVEKPNNDNSTSSKPVENPKPTPPVEKPVEKPIEKPQEPVKPEKPQRTWEYQGAMTQELWNLFNNYRQENGLNALTLSGKYAGWVKSQAELMAQKEDAIHGNYPEGGDVVGFNGSANMTASKILQQFKNSPQHNKNLLDDELTEGACAVYKDSNGVYYFVIGFDY